MTRSCEGCEHYGIRDYGYGPHERHDAYCWLYGIWTPSRCGDYNDQDNTSDDPAVCEAVSALSHKIAKWIFEQ